MAIEQTNNLRRCVGVVVTVARRHVAACLSRQIAFDFGANDAFLQRIQAGRAAGVQLALAVARRFVARRVDSTLLFAFFVFLPPTISDDGARVRHDSLSECDTLVRDHSATFDQALRRR